MKTKIVKPKPYFQVSMNCSNRAFYGTKSKLWEIGENIDEYQEIRQGNVSESCDYEGDLEEITIYNNEKSKEYIEIIKKEFGITEEIPVGMNIVFTVH